LTLAEQTHCRCSASGLLKSPDLEFRKRSLFRHARPRGLQPASHTSMFLQVPYPSTGCEPALLQDDLTPLPHCGLAISRKRNISSGRHIETQPPIVRLSRRISPDMTALHERGQKITQCDSRSQSDQSNYQAGSAEARQLPQSPPKCVCALKEKLMNRPTAHCEDCLLPMQL
jgi:hypothetical protein